MKGMKFRGYNPVQQRIQVEAIKRLVSTIVGNKNFNLWAVVYAILVFTALNWFPDGLASLTGITGMWKLIFALLIIIFIIFQIKRALQHEIRLEVLSEEEHPRVKVMSIFLSFLGEKKFKELENKLRDSTISENDLAGTSWEMPVTGIKYHYPELKTIYVITSAGDGGGSHAQFQVFREIVSSLFPHIEIIEFTEKGINFEDVKEVFHTVDELYNKTTQNIKPSEIIVDITGGQKTTSIAGAMATLARGRKFQYVSTIDKKVRSYDLTYFEEI